MSPRNQEKIFDPNYAAELMRIAAGDLSTAEVIGRSAEARIENAFYMCQQAVEKCLKAVLVARSVPVPLIHDLGALLAKLPENCDPPYGYELNELNQYASVRRYEEGAFRLSKHEFDEVLLKSREMLAWAKKETMGAGSHP